MNIYQYMYLLLKTQQHLVWICQKRKRVWFGHHTIWKTSEPLLVLCYHMKIMPSCLMLMTNSASMSLGSFQVNSFLIMDIYACTYEIKSKVKKYILLSFVFTILYIKNQHKTVFLDVFNITFSIWESKF